MTLSNGKKDERMGMMKREEIEKLNAGRQIDLLVAQQVMGWQLETDQAEIKRLDKYLFRDKDKRWWHNPEGGWRFDPPNYSTDIVAAWQVVEKMNIRGQALFLIQSLSDNNVAFDEPGTTEPSYISDKSVSGGICKAALLATFITPRSHALHGERLVREA